MVLDTKNITTYKDIRGEVYPCWRQGEYDIAFVEDRFSRSLKHSIRGFHGDSTTWKLFTCVYGSIMLVLWDIKRKAKKEMILSDENKLQVLVPPYYLNAHQCLSDECILYYKWSENYSGPENQWTVSWKDKEINANWTIDDPILSERDRDAHPLQDLILE
jgi:dTDP-4-dehydrorhamnose 3,5-epimerase